MLMLRSLLYKQAKHFYPRVGIGLQQSRSRIRYSHRHYTSSSSYAMEGTLHIYMPKRQLLLFEHTPRSNQISSSPPQQQQQQHQQHEMSQPHPPPNTILFIGGMFDNFLHPHYTSDLAHLFPRHPNQSWSTMHIQLSSAGRSFGTSSLDKDIEEIAHGITFIRTHLRPSSPGHIVLLGHSTGCQDVLHYLSAPNPVSPTKPTRPPVQGAILQAPVSDRDQAHHLAQSSGSLKSKLADAIHLATSAPKDQHRSVILPIDMTAEFFGPAPLSVARFLSLISPGSPAAPGPDDLFSEDGTAELHRRTFGVVGERGLLSEVRAGTGLKVLVLMSGADEYVPEKVDKSKLLERWREGMSGSGAELHRESGVIPGGKHGLEGEEEGKGEGDRARLVEFRGRVLRYLDEMVGGVDEVAWEGLRESEKALGVEGGDGDGDRGVGSIGRGVGDVKL